MSVSTIIERNGAPTHYLSIGFPQKFAEFFRSPNSHLWVVSIVDRNNIM